jgi:TolA-binding protein
VRAAEDLEASTLTYAEIKAIASGNPAVMEKVKVDTEVRKLDQLRAAHVNQQHSIRMQLHRLPLEIAEAQRNIATVAKDIAMRDAHADDEFSHDRGQPRLFRQGRPRGSREGSHVYACSPGAMTPLCKCAARSADSKS